MSRIFLLVVITLLQAGSVQSQILRVTPSGAGAMNGSSWANALPGGNLRQALRAAAPGAQFWVAAGTYKPHPTSRDSAFFIPGGVRMWGGFAGTETALGQQSPAGNVTVLSGDINNANDSTDNSLHVVVVSGGDSTGIDGFTVSWGNANGNLYNASGYGGGLISEGFLSTAFKIRRCTFTHNAAYSGGAIYMVQQWTNYSINGIIDSCTFQYNTCLNTSGSPYGGGGALTLTTDCYYVSSQATVSNCLFQHNSSGSFGGAVYYKMMGTAAAGYTMFKRCIFDQNASGIMGAFYCYGLENSAQLTLDSCAFTGNVATMYAGGMAAYVYEGHPAMNLSSCLFESNTGSCNSALYFCGQASPFRTANTHLNFRRCRFVKNTTSSGCNGGVSLQSLDYAVDTAVFTNCLFYNNEGTALMQNISNAASQITTLGNCTFFNDRTTSVSAGPNGIINNSIYSYTGSSSTNLKIGLNINNTIIYYDKQNGTFLRAITNLNGFTASQNYMSINIKNSIIKRSGGSGAAWDASFGIDSGKNLDVNPGFIDTAAGNLHLGCGATAIDTGSNTLIPAGISVDLDGNPRISNSKIDMGAYEFQGTNSPFFAAFNALNTIGRTDSFTYTGTTTGLDSLRWDFGDGSTSTLQNPVHTYAVNGIYTVCVYIYGPCGSRQTCRSITASCYPPNFTTVITPSSGNTIQCTYNGGGWPIDSLRWDFGDGGTSTLTNPAHTYTAAGVYTVCATAYNGCGGNKVCKSITVTCVGAIPAFTSNAPSGNTVRYTYTGSTTGIDSLIWNFGDGQLRTITNSFTAPVSHTFARRDSFTVCVTAFSVCGPNEACRQTLLPLGIGVEGSLAAARVYPNPAASEAVMIAGAATANAVLTNTVGQMLLSCAITTGLQPLSLSGLSAGVYILTLTAPDGGKASLRIIKQ